MFFFSLEFPALYSKLYLFGFNMWCKTNTLLNRRFESHQINSTSLNLICSYIFYHFLCAENRDEHIEYRTVAAEQQSDSKKKSFKKFGETLLIDSSLNHRALHLLYKKLVDKPRMNWLFNRHWMICKDNRCQKNLVRENPSEFIWWNMQNCWIKLFERKKKCRSDMPFSSSTIVLIIFAFFRFEYRLSHALISNQYCHQNSTRIQILSMCVWFINAFFMNSMYLLCI